MMKNKDSIILLLILISLAFFWTRYIEKQGKIHQAIADCIDTKSQNYPVYLDPETAWYTFYEQCANEK